MYIYIQISQKRYKGEGDMKHKTKMSCLQFTLTTDIGVSLDKAQKIESHLDILYLSVVVTHLDPREVFWKAFQNVLIPILCSAQFIISRAFNNLSRCTLQRLENGHLFY